MKTLFVFLFFTGAIMSVGKANDSKFVEAMQKSIQSLYAAHSREEIQQAVNSFERIGSVEKSRWEPYYYTAFGYVRMANKETDVAGKDAYLDRAQTAVEQAGLIKKDESEIVAMQGFITMIRITIDPATRGPLYAALVMQTYQNSLALNPNNPRALALLAQMQFGTAQFFNQPTTEACANAAKALTMLANDPSADLLAPKWGKEMTEGLLLNCK